jgi:hypothetical protein
VAAFSSWFLTHGCLADLRTDRFPTSIFGWNQRGLSREADGTHFGFVHTGPAVIRCGSGYFTLRARMYFSVPGELQIEQGSGLVVTRLGYHGFFHLGGPTEEHGRLRYIDGCTDSLLIPPIMHGDPCLNLLHLPPHTRQTPHTHPSLRVGLVVRGQGMCLTPERETGLSPGTVFVIDADSLHCFHTGESELLIIAYHPDSDFGPTDETHPMINRTALSEPEA